MKSEPRRMREQRWLIEKAVAAAGVDFSWPISRLVLGATCQDIHPDIMMSMQRMNKFADISREFAGVGAKCESVARKAEEGGYEVTAREYFFSAANLYGAAQWPIWEDDNDELMELSRKKNECYDKYIEYADHPIERVEIPFEGKSLPGYLHLPSRDAENVPCMLFFDGMDAWKEYFCELYGDRHLQRGRAILAVDGPGQAESSIRKIKVTSDNFPKAGTAAVDFLVERPEIDSERIAIQGVSFGTFWIPQVLAKEHRLKCGAIAKVCHEPGMNTIFNEASPTYKARHMWMAGYQDEKAFDKYAQSLTLEGVGSEITAPIIILAGEDDDLSPIEHTYRFYNEIKVPKTLVVFKGQKHSMQGPKVFTRMADWVTDRLNGVPLKSEIILVDITGKETKI
ncbi:alpha/beta hydrolase family protein [Thermodesulfobacteriota bacterium]